MNHMLLRKMAAWTLVFACMVPTPALAADLSGGWTLNYPFEEEPWTFAQAPGGRFTGVTPEFLFIELFARFSMVGTTSGTKFQGVTVFIVAGAPIPTGVVRGTVVGDHMSGRVVDVFFGVYDLEGIRDP
ncbi:hypothetical protein GC163_19795 [bacterium]|nr:hypothetical protein [bacterium]